MGRVREKEDSARASKPAVRPTVPTARAAEPSPGRTPVGDKHEGSILVADDADPLYAHDPWLPSGATSATTADRAASWTEYLQNRVTRPVPAEGASQPRQDLASEGVGPLRNSGGGGSQPSRPPGDDDRAGLPRAFPSHIGRGSGDDAALGRTAVIGAFQPRTRTAQADILERLRGLGLSHLFVEFPSTAILEAHLLGRGLVVGSGVKRTRDPPHIRWALCIAFGREAAKKGHVLDR